MSRKTHMDGSPAQDAQNLEAPSQERKPRVIWPDVETWPPTPADPDGDDLFEAVEGAEPYAVMSWHGRLLGRFDAFSRALECFLRWPAAASVIFAGTDILARKDEPGGVARKAVAA